jgi:hypothetical protein
MWTRKTLLAEAQRLIDQIDASGSEDEIRQLDGCLKAVQEVLIKQEKPPGVTWQGHRGDQTIPLK